MPLFLPLFSSHLIFFKLKKIQKFDPCSFLQLQNKLRLFRPHLDVFEVRTRTSFAIRAWPTLLGLAPNLSNPNLVPKHKTLHTNIRNSISLRKLLKLKRKLDSLELGIQQWGLKLQSLIPNKEGELGEPLFFKEESHERLEVNSDLPPKFDELENE